MKRIATIGFFDGVHSGHRYVLHELCRLAHEYRLQSLVLTFRQHPREVLQSVCPPLLTSPEERTALIRSCGVEQVEMLDFSQIRNLTAKRFMQQLHEKYEVELLLMGYDHRFGSDRPADFSDYQKAAAEVGLRLQQLAEYDSAMPHVSSTVCRRLLQEGNIQELNALLGYSYTLSGRVGHGNGIGRTIGFPTANLELDFLHKLLPPDGVYAAHTKVGGKFCRSLVNIGMNPTVNGKERTIEVYLHGFAGNLYGEQLQVQLLQFIRSEQHFSSLDELKIQIDTDLQYLLSLPEEGRA